MIESEVFDELFVLEMANNHWGKLDRGLKIVRDFSRIIRFNNVKAAIKIQLRDGDTFIHKDFRDRRDLRYIAKTLDTQMSHDDFCTLVQAIRQAGCLDQNPRGTRHATEDYFVRLERDRVPRRP